MKRYPARTLTVASLAVLVLGSCSATRGVLGIDETTSSESQLEPVFPWNVDTGTGATPLLSHDGGVVQPGAPGAVVPGAPPTHDLTPNGEGRMYIVELYQQAIDERDHLQIEVDTLLASLDGMQRELELARAAQEQSEASLLLEQNKNDDLFEQNLELADRLATAQLRRLEAERILLETKLAWLASTSRTPPAGEPLVGAAPAQPGALEPAAVAGAPSAWDMALRDD